VRAVGDLDRLLNDHASLELKAAQQAQRLIQRYGAAESAAARGLSAEFRSELINKMSRLAREELRHFEQVVALIEARGGRYSAISPSRYAAGLHDLARKSEPDALVDALIIGAVIEARSCERFFSLVEQTDRLDDSVAKFYTSLLRSEARHFQDYLALARSVPGADISSRVEELLERDVELIESVDSTLRFLSGPPLEAGELPLDAGRR
jgi:tRNA-(ms[2]io[6]A)-hydroxylase